MRATEDSMQQRFRNRLPNSIKNPRKLKKAWKLVLLARLRADYGRNGSRGFRYRLHWVPRSGWTVTASKMLRLVRRELKAVQGMILFVGLFLGCESKPRTLEAPIPKQELREHLDESERQQDRKSPRVFTDEELVILASYEQREGGGMSFYYAELRKRNDAEWAKAELERRKAAREH